jgi:hypothetical protein
MARIHSGSRSYRSRNSLRAMGSFVTSSTRGLGVISSRPRIQPQRYLLAGNQLIGIPPVTLEELIALLTPILPHLLLDEERDGEVIVYTGLREEPSGRLTEVTDPA